MAPRAILFDLDDTLVDRPRSLEVFLAHFRAEHGSALGPVEDATLLSALAVADDSGYRAREEMAQMILDTLPWRARPEAEHLMAHWRSAFPACAVPMDGMRETLDTLASRGIVMGVITNGPTQTQHAKIDAVGIRAHFRAIVIAEEVGAAKPDARIFAHAARAVDVEPADAWFVGDNPLVDVVGAADAGMTGVWLRSRVPDWPDAAPSPPLALDRLPELLSFVSPTG